MSELHKKFSLDHLSDVEFEDYCFTLMKLMGYKNVDWRKGTGYDASPADKGRDIVCDSQRVDVDAAEYMEHWFVQCKHYKKGVPVDKISDALAWAEAEQPDVLLLIASNFFSNPTKEYIETYRQNKKPKFRIKLWERPNLEDYSQGRTLLLSRYKLADKLEYLDSMHPAHLEYIKSSHMNELDDLFGLLDEFSDDEKMRISGLLWEAFLMPRYRKAITGKETMGELRIDPVNYDLFKKRCYEIAQSGILPSYLLTNFLVNQLLQETFYRGDTTSVARYKARIGRYMEGIQEVEPDSKKQEEFKQRIQSLIDGADDSYREGHRVYMKFCDQVVSRLLLLPGGSVD